MDEIEINTVRFIIDRLILENNLDDYYKWFIAILDADVFKRRDHNDKEYTYFTNKAIRDYFIHLFPYNTFDQVVEYHYNQRGLDNEIGYFHFDVSRYLYDDYIFVNENFYNNFINEVLTYNDNDTGLTLK